MRLKVIALVVAIGVLFGAYAQAVDLASVFGAPQPLPVQCEISLSKPALTANGVDSTVISILLNGVPSSAPVNVTLQKANGTTVSKPNVVFPITATSSAPGYFTFSASDPSNNYNCPAVTIMAH